MKDPFDLDDERPAKSYPGPDTSSFGRGQDDSRPWLYAVAGAAVLGATFAAVSTHDFITHLDRQVHAIHCSFIPGAGQNLGESGCRTVMLSPYSSLFRTSMWGGLPISLLALAVFSYLVCRALDFALRREGVTKRDTTYLIAATLLPVAMSIVYGFISASKLDALCKLCVGIYISSALLLLFSLIAHSKARFDRSLEPRGGLYARWFLEGVAYVAILGIMYIVLAPESPKSAEGCGTLVKSDDPNGILIPLNGRAGGAASVAVLDPLCPACKSFDERLEASGLEARLNLRAVLFPLDASCNWMVKNTLHPGACAMSEAILCDKDNAPAMLDWAFENQESLRAAAANGDSPVRKRIADAFPKTKGCMGTATIKNKLNKSLRWAVANALPVLTPQLFIGDRRVCDEDTDLGLEYTITAMLDHKAAPKAGR